jgi:hypothetical protein
MIVIAAVDDDKRQPLAFGGRHRRPWQWRWQSSTAAIAVVVDVDDRTTGGADKFLRRTMQQARSNRRHNNQPLTGVSEMQ